MSSLMNLTGSLLEDEGRLVVVCNISGNILGLPTAPIQEVLAIPEIRPVHHAPSYVKGVFNLRGRVIVLIDPAVKLELEPQITCSESRILVVQAGSELLGVLVDSLLGIFPFSPEQLTASPESLSRSLKKAVEGFFFLNNKMVGLLKIDELLERNTEANLEAGEV